MQGWRKSLQRWWKATGLATPVAQWQKRLLDTFLLALLIIAGIVIAINGSLWLAAPSPVLASFVVGDLLSALVVASLWALNRAGRTRLAGYLYLTVQIAMVSFVFTLGSLDRVMVIYAVPILTASFIIAPAASFVFAALSILSYTLTYLIGGAQPSYNYIAVLILLLLAVIAWLIARWLRQVMRAVRDEATAHKQAEEEIRRQAGMLRALHETALDLAAPRTLPDLLQAIVARAAGLLGAMGGGVYLYRPPSDDLEYVYMYNEHPSFAGSILRRGEGLAGRVLASGRPLAVSDYDHWEGRHPLYSGKGLAAAVAVPIIWGEHILGVLVLDADSPRTITQEDIALLERFAPLAAAALENHHLLQGLGQRMEQLQTAQAQLIQSARMAATGSLAAGVAHEINNPMTIITGFAEMLAEELPGDSSYQKDVQRILVESRRVGRIVRAMLDFSRQTKPDRRPANINEVVRQTLALVGEQLARSGVTVEEEYAPDLGPVALDTVQMQQVFFNLFTNAMQAMPQGGHLRLRTSQVEAEVMVAFSDTGVGMSSDVLEHVFEPFFTTNPAEQSGLGLSVSLGIVKEHGGRITVESQEGQGSTFTVWLPGEAGESNE